MQKYLYKTRNKGITLIKSRLEKLIKNNINKMSGDEKEIDKPYEIVDIVENKKGQG